MNLRALKVVPLLLAMALSGCVIVSRSPGDITFLWSFSGQTCSTVPAVRSVRIHIPGQTLQNDGVYDCSTGGTAGIVVHDFRGGFYTFSIEGRDSSGYVLYQGQGSFTVDGSVTVNVDLAPAQSQGGTGVAYLNWTFPPNKTSSTPTCAQAGIDTVYVSIDGSAWVSYPCGDGQTASGVVSSTVTVGTHTIDLSAVNAQGYEYYALRSTLYITAQPTAQQFDLDWAVGGATVRWTVTSGGSTSSCAVAGISTVYVNFRDAQGNLVYAGSGDPQPCSNLSVVYYYLKPGVYDVFLSAVGAGSSVYESSRTAPPKVTVQAAAFTTPNDGPNILLNRVQ